MSERIERQCWCGCKSFSVYQWEKRKGDVIIICQGCKCERHVSTPDVSVSKYEIRPKFAEEGQESFGLEGT